MEDDGWGFKFSHSKCGERAFVLEAACDVLREGLGVEVERGRHLGSTCIVVDDVFQPLRGCCKRWLFWGEGATMESRLVSLNLWVLLGLSRFWSCHWSHRRLIDKSELMTWW